MVLRKDVSYFQMMVIYHFDGFVLLDAISDEPASPPMELSGDDEEVLDEEVEGLVTSNGASRGEGSFGSTGSAPVAAAAPTAP